MTDTHPDAERLIGLVRERDPGISTATVYNSIRVLVEAGEIREIRGLGRTARYDANLSDHDHFTCRVCGGVQDIPRQQPIPRRLAGRGLSRYLVEEVHAHVRGVCGTCRSSHPISDHGLSLINPS